MRNLQIKPFTDLAEANVFMKEHDVEDVVIKRVEETDTFFVLYKDVNY